MTTTDTTAPAAERCFDLTMRVERIVHLGTMATETPDYELTEWLIGPAEAALCELLGITSDQLDAFMEDGELSDYGREELPIAIARRAEHGWIVEAAQPVFSERSTSGARSYSWGHYQTACFAGATYDEALTKAFAWADANLSS